MDNTPTWTFVVDYDGGTYVSQFVCTTILEAISLYNDTDPSNQGAVPVRDGFVKLTGLRNAFCTSGMSEPDDKLIVVNIIKTDVTDWWNG